MLSDTIFKNQKEMLLYYKDYFDKSQETWLKVYNHYKLDKNIDYDFIIFNKKFYIDNDLVGSNSHFRPFSLSWTKPKLIVSRLETNKMIKKLIKWCDKEYKELDDERDFMIEYLCIPYNKHTNVDREKMRWYCRKISELNLARTILKSINYEKFYHFL